MPASATLAPPQVSFVGLGKESTRGTAAAATVFIPVKKLTFPNTMPHYTPDDGMRGSAVKTYDMIATQTWSEPSYDGDAFSDSFGYWLHMLMGEVAVAGPVSTVYTHTFTTLNTAPFQPPSYTITDYNGIQAKQVPGALVSEIQLKFTATGLVEYSVKLVGFKESNVSTPSKTFTTEVVKPAWQGVVTLGGSATTLLADGEITVKRTAEAVPTVNGTQDPAAIWAAGDLEATGKLNLLYTNETEYAKFVAGTSSSLDISFTSGATTTLRTIGFHCSKTLYTAAIHDRAVGSKGYVTIPFTFTAVANTSDVGSSGGYGPIKWTLANLISSY